MSSLNDVKKILLDTGATFVLIKGAASFRSEDRGVAPILSKLSEEGEPLKGSFVADRVIGKAAALLLVYGEIDSLYAVVISSYAAKVLEDHAIAFKYGKMVPNIINRDGTDMCPMEKAVLQIDDPAVAYRTLLAKVRGG
jgi:hypothetical protein